MFYIYDDAIRSMEGRDQIPSDLAEEIGRAVINLSLNPDFTMELEPPHRVTWHHLQWSGGSHGNAMTWVDRPHSTDVRPYLWESNALQRLDQLDLERLEQMRTLVEREIDR
ncbi:MAG TPA: hypothetical protein VHV50_03890, partial [Actinomycetota bacterium]|nr:hypothetical protein [Actinomycetota bacterium]